MESEQRGLRQDLTNLQLFFHSQESSMDRSTLVLNDVVRLGGDRFFPIHYDVTLQKLEKKMRDPGWAENLVCRCTALILNIFRLLKYISNAIRFIFSLSI